MAYTFGGATSDDVSIASHGNINSGGNCLFGWWYPTTLTAGKAYWGASATSNVKVGPTTSELRVAVDRATTDMVVDTSGAGITVDQWHFIALVRSQNAGESDLRLWIGHGTDPPLPIGGSFTTVGSGGETSATTATVGNSAVADTNAFQGDIEQVLDGRWANSQIAPLPNATPATITNEEADHFYNACVVPYWLGDPQPTWVRGTTTQFYVFDLSSIGAQLDIHQRGATQRLTPELLTVNGATISQRRAPMPALQAWPPKLQFCRRR